MVDVVGILSVSVRKTVLVGVGQDGGTTCLGSRVRGRRRWRNFGLFGESCVRPMTTSSSMSMSILWLI